eukprot:gb/GECG01009114.1/.p1 GENE.gb/GECG01009114.1/~~gb/GECG01009114.1/.p1  ORF type:complete len:1091 (+),score=174.05 gb/GECG01009114.1/:1-3273(+)
MGIVTFDIFLKTLEWPCSDKENAAPSPSGSDDAPKGEYDPHARGSSTADGEVLMDVRCGKKSLTSFGPYRFHRNTRVENNDVHMSVISIRQARRITLKYQNEQGVSSIELNLLWRESALSSWELVANGMLYLPGKGDAEDGNNWRWKALHSNQGKNLQRGRTLVKVKKAVLHSHEYTPISRAEELRTSFITQDVHLNIKEPEASFEPSQIPQPAISPKSPHGNMQGATSCFPFDRNAQSFRPPSIRFHRSPEHTLSTPHAGSTRSGGAVPSDSTACSYQNATESSEPQYSQPTSTRAILLRTTLSSGQCHVEVSADSGPHAAAQLSDWPTQTHISTADSTAIRALENHTAKRSTDERVSNHDRPIPPPHTRAKKPQMPADLIKSASFRGRSSLDEKEALFEVEPFLHFRTDPLMATTVAGQRRYQLCSSNSRKMAEMGKKHNLLSQSCRQTQESSDLSQVVCKLRKRNPPTVVSERPRVSVRSPNFESYGDAAFGGTDTLQCSSPAEKEETVNGEEALHLSDVYAEKSISSSVPSPQPKSCSPLRKNQFRSVPSGNENQAKTLTASHPTTTSVATGSLAVDSSGNTPETDAGAKERNCSNAVTDGYQRKRDQSETRESLHVKTVESPEASDASFSLPVEAGQPQQEKEEDYDDESFHVPSDTDTESAEENSSEEAGEDNSSNGPVDRTEARRNRSKDVEDSEAEDEVSPVLDESGSSDTGYSDEFDNDSESEEAVDDHSCSLPLERSQSEIAAAIPSDSYSSTNKHNATSSKVATKRTDVTREAPTETSSSGETPTDFISRWYEIYNSLPSVAATTTVEASAASTTMASNSPSSSLAETLAKSYKDSPTMKGALTKNRVHRKPAGPPPSNNLDTSATYASKKDKKAKPGAKLLQTLRKMQGKEPLTVSTEEDDEDADEEESTSKDISESTLEETTSVSRENSSSKQEATTTKAAESPFVSGHTKTHPSTPFSARTAFSVSSVSNDGEDERGNTPRGELQYSDSTGSVSSDDKSTSPRLGPHAYQVSGARREKMIASLTSDGASPRSVGHDSINEAIPERQVETDEDYRSPSKAERPSDPVFKGDDSSDSS